MYGGVHVPSCVDLSSLLPLTLLPLTVATTMVMPEMTTNEANRNGTDRDDDNSGVTTMMITTGDGRPADNPTTAGKT
jgi:hypothetical protein